MNLCEKGAFEACNLVAMTAGPGGRLVWLEERGYATKDGYNVIRDLNQKPGLEGAGVEMPKETEIGFHQGCLNTLVAERNELFKMIQNVEAIMQAHLKRLEELGVKIEKKGK